MSKNALLIGINDYECCPLQGCINDVLAMEHYLDGQGFTISKLLDKNATCANIKAGLKTLIGGAKVGDTIIFHYSGHGSQVPEHNGLPSKKADGMSEIICPVDINFYNGTYITDHELNNMFSALPKGVLAEVILDCCHSGTALRDINPSVSSLRHIQMPNDVSEKRTLTRDLVLLDPNAQNNAVLWAACAYNESAADAFVANTYHGAFTYSFLVTLQNGNVKRKDLEASVITVMRRNSWTQSPQLECTSIEQETPFLTFGATSTKNVVSTIKPEPAVESTRIKNAPALKDINPETVISNVGTAIDVIKEIAQDAGEVKEAVEELVIDVEHFVADAAKLANVFGRPVPMNRTGKSSATMGLTGRKDPPATLK